MPTSGRRRCRSPGRPGPYRRSLKLAVSPPALPHDCSSTGRSARPRPSPPALPQRAARRAGRARGYRPATRQREHQPGRARITIFDASSRVDTAGQRRAAGPGRRWGDAGDGPSPAHDRPLLRRPAAAGMRVVASVELGARPARRPTHELGECRGDLAGRRRWSPGRRAGRGTVAGGPGDDEQHSQGNTNHDGSIGRGESRDVAHRAAPAA